MINKKIIKLNETELEGLVRKIIKEDSRGYGYDMLSDMNDDVVYMRPGYHSEGDITEAIATYYNILQALEDENVVVTEEAKKLIDRIDHSISGLKGINERVLKLYDILLESHPDAGTYDFS